MRNSNTYEYGGVRYRVEDAIRLGLMTAPPVDQPVRAELVRTHSAPSGLITSQVQHPVAPVEPVPPAGDPVAPVAPDVQVDPEPVEPQTPAPVQASAPVDPNRPNNGQSKVTWVEYALSVGLTPEDLEGLGRDQIIDAVDAHQRAAAE